jgi:hypothetical protein
MRFLPSILSVSLLLVVIVSLSWSGCYQDSLEDIFPTTYSGKCDTDSVTYANFIKPLIDSRCRGCHKAGNTSGGVNLDDYSSLRVVALNGRLLGAIGHTPPYKPMPRNGTKLDSCTFKKVEAWINDGAL